MVGFVAAAWLEGIGEPSLTGATNLMLAESPGSRLVGMMSLGWWWDLRL